MRRRGLGFGHARWWTWDQFAALVDQGHAEVSARSNKRAVRCRVERHALCPVGTARMVWAPGGERVGFCCPTCVTALQTGAVRAPLQAWE